MNYENYLIREMTEDQCEPERDAFELDQVESFTGWLDAQGDALAPADSFSEWLTQTEDKI